MNKRIIFFDGDGTLWYPKTTKRKEAPDWLYVKYPEPQDYLKHLVLTPSILIVLNKLKKRGIILVALSTHPHSRQEADIRMQGRIKHLKLDKIFDEIYTARPYPWGKGKVMVSVLKNKKIPKSKALLVGDSYLYDYRSAKTVGIECLLIATPYTKYPVRGKKAIDTITNLKQLLNLIDVL